MMDAEQALSLLLAGWRVPCAPDALRLRVVESYRRQLGRPEAEEDAEMKRCPMCYEEFAPQFRFCPVDGLPLVANETTAQAGVFTETDVEPTPGAHDARAPRAPHGTAFDVGEAGADNFAPPPVAVGAPTAHGAYAHAEYQPTILTDAGLIARLTKEVRAVATESQLTWPELRRDPAGFARRTVAGYGLVLRRLVAQENVAYGLAAALVVVLTLVGAVVALDRYHKTRELALTRSDEEYELTGWVNTVPTKPEQTEGPAGMAHGTGGGSQQNRERPGGGGGGGNHEALPASSGKLPLATLAPPIVAPNPKPPDIPNPHLPVSASIQADPVLFPPDPRALPYGDPKSQAQELSAGSGDGGSIGDGHGGGVGPGNGTGYGPGEGWNTGGGPPKLGGGGPGCCGGTTDYSKTFSMKEVTRRAQITFKPEPTFTEEA
ncbi:MAG TPA: hypothetical protein VE775_06130, partial [Pyrinomonadaceae bacterium]|nr:hypothetical protein [Pyrinomonadaceae bacterium]